jgi:hypothetical protein
VTFKRFTFAKRSSLFVLPFVHSWDKYVLLADVICQLGVTQRQFLDKHGDVPTLKISWNSFKMQTMLADFDAVERRLCALEEDDEIDAGVNRSEQYFENNRFTSRVRHVTVIRCSNRVRQLLEIDGFKTRYQLY